MKYLIVLAFVAAVFAAPVTSKAVLDTTQQHANSFPIDDKRQGSYFTYCCGANAEDATITAEDAST